MRSSMRSTTFRQRLQAFVKKGTFVAPKHSDEWSFPCVVSLKMGAAHAQTPDEQTNQPRGKSHISHVPHRFRMRSVCVPSHSPIRNFVWNLGCRAYTPFQVLMRSIMRSNTFYQGFQNLPKSNVCVPMRSGMRSNTFHQQFWNFSWTSLCVPMRSSLRSITFWHTKRCMFQKTAPRSYGFRAFRAGGLLKI